MKRRIANVETEKIEQLSQLQAELDSVIAERDSLKASGPSADSSREQELNEQLQTLQREKEALQAQVAELQAATTAAASSVPDAELAAKLVCRSADESELVAKHYLQAHVEKERDDLLAERSVWVIASSNPAGAEGDVDTEKAELIKARDEAIALAKVYDTSVAYTLDAHFPYRRLRQNVLNNSRLKSIV